jgi:phosphoenolpyruvate synthase/pyruvate phosphate dikinase
MLSRGWKIPYATIRSAPQQYKDLDGKYVKFIAGENGYSITLASEPEIQALQKNILIHAKEVRAHANLDNTELADLSNQRKGDAEVFGAKSANLGELIHIHSSPFGVPPGFTIPFYYYDSFIKSNELHQFIAETLASEQFKQDSTYRDKQLEIIRDKIQNTELDHEFTTMLLDKVHKDFNQKGVFVRSSSNAEDLPNFSGAGLYSTVPNVKTDKQLIAAVKTVWASVWNKDAFEARENFGMDHFSVYPAVIIQEGMNADAAGVMVTTNPFNNADKSAVYINAKKGLGMKVVDGHNVPEQIMYHPRSQAINVITRSRESSMTIFNEDGGVKNVNIEPRQAVLSEKMIRKLVKAAQSIEKQFGYEQDIEWLFEGEQLYIVQSRPYIQDQ